MHLTGQLCTAAGGGEWWVILPAGVRTRRHTSKEGRAKREETLERLRDEFDTTKLLVAVDELDHIRNVVADGDNLEPPEVRDQLLKLHGIAMAVINEGHPLSGYGNDSSESGPSRRCLHRIGKVLQVSRSTLGMPHSS